MKKEAKRARIVARILAAEDKGKAIMAEAQRNGVSSRTIERWVESVQKAQTVSQDVVTVVDAPPGEPAENPVLDQALKDEGAAPEAGKPAVDGQISVKQGLADMEKFCIDAYSGIRSAVGSVMVSIRYTPPLDATSPEVLRLLQIGTAAELAIRANAPKLYPILVKHASGWGALLFAIGADAIGLVMGLEGLAKSKGWTPAPKRATDRPAPAAVPTPREYGEQLRPAPSQTESSAKGQDTVVNAPLPSEEQVALAAQVRQVVAG